MSSTDFGNPDVIVVGAGNAACCAALAAKEHGASVIVLEAAPEDDAGGNSRYTGGLMRVVYNNVEDLAQLIPDLTEEEKKTHDYGQYTAEDYFDDMGRITQYMSDPDLTEILITKSFDTLVWLRKKGVRFQPSYGRQSYKVEGGGYKFFGGLVAETWGGGAGLIENEHKACEREGIKIFYETPALSLDYGRCRNGDGRQGQVQGTQRRHRVQGGRARMPAASSRAPRCARAISGPAGTSRRSAARATTSARASRWRSTSARCRMATGPAVTRSAGTGMRRPTAT